jgi:hypothetical protein
MRRCFLRFTWLARVRDGADRRRTLVWLTDAARARLADEQEVLSLDMLERAMSRMTPRDRRLLLEGTRALVEAGGGFAGPRVTARQRKGTENERPKAPL